MQNKSVKMKLVESAHLPKDVSLGVPILRLNGYNELYVENYRGILEYTDELIRVQTKIGQLHVVGKGLQIEFYSNDEMKIIGKLEFLKFQQGETK